MKCHSGMNESVAVKLGMSKADDKLEWGWGYDENGVPLSLD